MNKAIEYQSKTYFALATDLMKMVKANAFGVKKEEVVECTTCNGNGYVWMDGGCSSRQNDFEADCIECGGDGLEIQEI